MDDLGLSYHVPIGAALLRESFFFWGGHCDMFLMSQVQVMELSGFRAAQISQHLYTVYIYIYIKGNFTAQVPNQKSHQHREEGIQE